MGIYEYACSHCNHVTEVFVPLSARHPVIECEMCGAPATYTISPVPTTFRSNDRRAFKRSGR